MPSAIHYKFCSLKYRFKGERTKSGPIAQLRLERTPDKREVGGSNPPRPILFFVGEWV